MPLIFIIVLITCVVIIVMMMMLIRTFLLPPAFTTPGFLDYRYHWDLTPRLLPVPAACLLALSWRHAACARGTHLLCLPPTAPFAALAACHCLPPPMPRPRRSTAALPACRLFRATLCHFHAAALLLAMPSGLPYLRLHTHLRHTRTRTAFGLRFPTRAHTLRLGCVAHAAAPARVRAAHAFPHCSLPSLPAHPHTHTHTHTRTHAHAHAPHYVLHTHTHTRVCARTHTHARFRYAHTLRTHTRYVYAFAFFFLSDDRYIYC